MYLVPLINLLRGFALEGLFLSIFVSTSLGPLAKIAELQGLDSEGQLWPVSASSSISPLEAIGLKRIPVVI